tara:strand:+ start:462 stop:659 length:198 start_codon:yes stop_codon:yes gene_type:complete
VGQDLIWRDEIPQYLDEEVSEAIHAWNLYKSFGMPRSGGFLDQPKKFTDVVLVLDAEANRPREGE